LSIFLKVSGSHPTSLGKANSRISVASGRAPDNRKGRSKSFHNEGQCTRIIRKIPPTGKPGDMSHSIPIKSDQKPPLWFDIRLSSHRASFRQGHGMTTVDRERHQRGLVCPVGARLDVPYWKTSDLPLSSLTPQYVIPTPPICHSHPPTRLSHESGNPESVERAMDPRFRGDDGGGEGGGLSQALPVWAADRNGPALTMASTSLPGRINIPPTACVLI